MDQFCFPFEKPWVFSFDVHSFDHVWLSGSNCWCGSMDSHKKNPFFFVSTRLKWSSNCYKVSYRFSSGKIRYFLSRCVIRLLQWLKRSSEVRRGIAEFIEWRHGYPRLLLSVLFLRDWVYRFVVKSKPAQDFCLPFSYFSYQELIFPTWHSLREKH